MINFRIFECYLQFHNNAMKSKIGLIILFFSIQICFGQNTILWKVTNPKTKNTSYLIGTFHQFGEKFVNQYPKIEKLISVSDIAYFESLKIDSTETQKIINSRKTDNSISKYFNKKQMEKLEDYFNHSGINLTKITPIELKFKLQQKYTRKVCKTTENSEENQHFDNYLIHIAEKYKINKVGFETTEEQISLLNQEYKDMTWQNQKKEILFYVSNIESKNPDITDKENLCGFAEKYKKFDLNYQFDKSSPLKTLTVARNNEWLKSIIPILLEDKKIFIAVGYMHLMYKEGLIEQLKQNGFIVQPEPMN